MTATGPAIQHYLGDGHSDRDRELDEKFEFECTRSLDHRGGAVAYPGGVQNKLSESAPIDPVRVPFVIIDVFAQEPLAGNPLALVPDADELTDERMRAIAREFNQSETTFVVQPTLHGADWRLRSFTPGGLEVLGAGHNAMGAWIWLAASGRLPEGRERFTQQIGDDLLGVEVVYRPHEGAVVTMEQSAPVFGAEADDRDAVAAALGLVTEEIAPGRLPQVVSTGAGHLLVEVLDQSVVDRVVPDVARLLEVLRSVGGEGCYVYSLDPIDPDGGSVAYARFFNPTVGIAEDPATGTAAGPLVASLIASGLVVDGVTAVVEQGRALGRPSRLSVTVSGDSVRLSGSGLTVAEGSLLLSP